MKNRFLIAGILLFVVYSAFSQQALHQPIIDVHLHGFKIFPGAMLAGVSAPKTQGEYEKQLLALLETYNIHAFTSGDDSVLRSLKTRSQRIFASRLVWSPLEVNLRQLKKEIAEKKWMAIGEVCTQYQGLSANDSSIEKIYLIAEETNLPLGIHLGIGDTHFPDYRVALTHPLLIEQVVRRHPKLRLYVMHAGYPMMDEMLAILFTYPQVYVDIAADDWILPRSEFYNYLKRLVEAGFGNRIMFGSDEMMWPKAIEIAIKNIEEAPFLSEIQKRDIFFNNAIHFFELNERDF